MHRPLRSALLLLLLGGCSSSAEPRVTLWEGTFVPTAPGGVSGLVAAVAQGGRTQFSVEIRQGVPGEAYGWRVAEGSCQAEGTILGGVALYPPMTPDPSRSARAEAAVPGQLSQGGSYAARVFRQAGGAEAVVACAQLAETG